MIRATVRPVRAIAIVLAVAVVGGWLALPRPDAVTPSVVPSANAAVAVGIVTASPPAAPGASAAVNATAGASAGAQAGATASSATIDPGAPAASSQPGQPGTSAAPTVLLPAAPGRPDDLTGRRRLGSASATPLARAASGRAQR